MKDTEFIPGVCCEYCKKFETAECPVKTASPWSRWDYCNNFRDNNDKTLLEIFKEESGVRK